MKKNIRFGVLAISGIVAIFTLVIGIILCFKFFDLLGDVFKNSGIANYSIVSIICLVLNLFIIAIAAVSLTTFETKDKNVVAKVQFGLFLFSLFVLLVMVVVYVVTNMTSISSIYDVMKGSVYGNSSYNELEEAVAFVETLLQNNITICTIINSIAVTLFCGFVGKVDAKTEENKNTNVVVDNANTIELSQNEQMKKEIAELKQALEMEDLKEEYTKLYKELKEKKSKE